MGISGLPQSFRNRMSACLCEVLEARRLMSSAYLVTDLGIAGNGPMTPLVMNNQGDVLGGYQPETLTPPFVYSDGKFTPLPPAFARLFRRASGQDIVPLSLSDSGDILGGVAGSRSGSYKTGGLLGTTTAHYALPDAFIFDGRKVRHLGAGFAVGSNSSGEILVLSSPADVYWATDTTNGSLHGVKSASIYNGKKHTQLKLPTGAGSIVGGAIDNAGNVVLVGNGIYVYPPGSKTATQISTETLSGVAISAGRVVTGTTPAGDVGVVNNGQFTDLGPPPSGSLSVHGVNASGAVVGTTIFAAFDSLPVYTAVVSNNGAMTDLNSLAPPDETGWLLQSAQAINDAGQIVVIAQANAAQQYQYLDEPFHALLLTPVSPAG